MEKQTREEYYKEIQVSCLRVACMVTISPPEFLLWQATCGRAGGARGGLNQRISCHLLRPPLAPPTQMGE